MTKTLAKVFGLVFLLVGLLGFVSNPIIGTTGIFMTNSAHNIVHILIGLVLLLTAKREATAALWMKIIGAVYLLVALLGFFSNTGMVLGFISVNSADNWLHLVLAVVLLGVGLMAKKEGSMPMNTMNMSQGQM